MELKENQLSIMRRYPLETLITALFLCIGVMTTAVYKNTQQIEELHDRMEKYQKEDSRILLSALEKNTEALNRFYQKSEK